MLNSEFCGLALSSALAFLPIEVDSMQMQTVASVSHIHSLAEVQVTHPEKTLFLLDLDDTVFDFPHMLGSRAWRGYIRQAAQKIDNSRNWHDVLSHHLTTNYPVKTVEGMTSQFVKDMQAKDYVVCGFTSRERTAWYDTPQKDVDVMTTDQLNSVGIDFNNNALQNTYPYLALDAEYFSGTFFCNIEPKGNFLTHLFQDAPERPTKVVFIDDKISQVESVATALKALGIPYESYCYGATNAKAAAFNPLFANIQLYHFYQASEIISDEEAALIAQEHPEKDAEFYLRAVLEMAKN